MKTSNGRRCSCGVPSLRRMSLIVTYIAWSETGVLILYVEPISTSGRSSFSCIQITLSWAFKGSFGAAPGASLASGLSTRYLAIFFSILMCAMSELPVIAFFQGIEEIRRGVHFAVIFDLLIPARLDLSAVFEREYVGGVLEIVLLDQNPLECFRVEAKRGAALQALFEGIQVDILEILVLVIGWDVRRLGDGRVHPQLGRRLNVDMFFRPYVVRRDEVVGQLFGRHLRIRHGARIHEFAVREKFERKDVDLFFRLLAFANDIAKVMVRERRLDAVRSVVGERQRDGSGGRDRRMVGESRAHFGELVDQFRRRFGDALHIAAISRMQYPARHLGADAPAILHHLGTLAQHFAGDREFFAHDRCGTLLPREFQPGLPPRNRHFTRYVL